MHIKASLGSEEFSWLVQESPYGTLTLSDDNQCSYNQFLKIMTGENLQLIPEKYAKITKNFVSSSMMTPLLMPKHQLKKTLKKSENLLKSSCVSNLDVEYFSHWVKIHNFLFHLYRAKIDETKLKDLMKELDTENSRNFLSFMPDPSGFARKISYNLSDTTTGRIKVASGPQILTAKHEIRNCITSRHAEGTVVMVDFTSIEPRIALITAEKNVSEDVYADLLNEFPQLKRDAAKLATLVALYGGRINRLSEIVNDVDVARKAVAFVRSHFRVDALERKLENQANEGMVRNYLGRPLREATKNSRIRINHFLQSSAAELSILLFAELCQKFEEKAFPIFVIHDALIVDVKNEFLQEFLKEANKIQWNGNHMAVKTEVLWHT